jgi:DUF1016 N-terminal domain
MGSGRSSSSIRISRAKKVAALPRQSAKPSKTPMRKTLPTAMAKATGGSEAKATDHLFRRIVSILEDARARVVRTVNSEMVLAYWHIGREIVEHLQEGDPRADYGMQVIDELARRLGMRFGLGF